MPNVALHNIAGDNIGEIALSENVFGAEVNQYAVHEVVKAYLANQRQGTQSALTRGEVRGGGRKIYRQKGTGNARHHGNRAPQFRHGGVVFAPKPRDYVINVPKKIRRLAFKSAMTSKLNAGEIIVVDEIKLAEPKTKLVAKVLGNSRRKQLTTVRMREMEAGGWADTDAFDRYLSMKDVKRLDYFLNGKSRLYYLFFIRDGKKTLLLIDPSQEIVNMMAQYSKVLEK